MNRVVSFLGLIRKAGKLDVGEEPVGSAARAKSAKLIILANDTTDNTIRRASHFASVAKAPYVSVPLTKTELGSAIGRPPCAMISINDIGLAANLVGKLVPSNPELYTELYEELNIKAEKTLKRKKQTKPRKHTKRQ